MGVPSAVCLGEKFASTPLDIANLFADFFKSNFVQDDDSEPYTFCQVNQPTALNFGSLRLTSDDVISGIKSLKHSTRTDVDGLCSVFLKKCPAIVVPLKFVFNKSLSSGVFVDDWKVTAITPIFKSGKKNDVANYRPISKLSTIAKLFEWIVKEKMYFAVKSLISPNQHGFVAGRSTLTNLAVFEEYCIDAFSAGLQVDCIYTDFAKAFDKVSHTILLRKLSLLDFTLFFLNGCART